MTCSCGHHHAPAAPLSRKDGEITLTGQLICRDMGQMLTVLDHADAHVAATRAEPGCLSFELRQSENPLVFDVAEHFRDRAAFDAHKARSAASDWGRATATLERRYSVQGPA